jgi:hypothetical protein
MSPMLKRCLLISYPIWMVGVIFVYWAFFIIDTESVSPTLHMVRSSVGIAVAVYPYLLLIWLYETGKLDWLKPGP